MKKIFCSLFLCLFALNSNSTNVNKFKEFRKQKIFTDIVLIANDNIEHHCHKVILGVFSEYFEKMFTLGLKESNNSQVQMPYSSQAINIILDFVYDSKKYKMDTFSIAQNLYFELLDFTGICFSSNLKSALKEVKVDIKQENIKETFKVAIAYQDKIILDKIFSPLDNKWTNNELVLMKKLGTGFIGSDFFNNDERLIASISYNNAQVLDAYSGQELFTLRCHTARVNSASFNNDGSRIVTCSQDYTTKVWNAFTNQEILSIKLFGYSAFFSNDGLSIITVSDSSVGIWDAINGQKLFDCNAYINCFYCSRHVKLAGFSKDGLLIVFTHHMHNSKMLLFPVPEFHDNNALFSSKDPLSWLLLKYYLLHYLHTINKDEKPSYNDFISQQEEIKFLIENLSKINNLLLNYLRKLFDMPS